MLRVAPGVAGAGCVDDATVAEVWVSSRMAALIGAERLGQADMTAARSVASWFCETFSVLIGVFDSAVATFW